MSLSEFDELLPSKESTTMFKEENLVSTNAEEMFQESELLPAVGGVNDNDDDNLFKEPEDPADSQLLPFPSLIDIPDFSSHFPIEDGNFGDLEFLDLASDRFFSKNKNLGSNQYSDIYFNSLATPSGYCSTNYLIEEANRLSLLLSESSTSEKDNNKNSGGNGEALDRSLIENLEELFGVSGGGCGNDNNRQSEQPQSLDAQLPNVMMERSNKVEFQVPNDVLSIMAKNLENLEDMGKQKDLSTAVPAPNSIPKRQQWVEPPRSTTTKISQQRPPTPLHKTITIKSVTPYSGEVAPEGAVAKIILQSSKKNNRTKIIFSSIDDTEQHSFSLNTSDMRRAAQLIRYYNLDNMEALRRLLHLGPIPDQGPSRKNSCPTKQPTPSPLLKDEGRQSSPSPPCPPLDVDDTTMYTPAVSPLRDDELDQKPKEDNISRKVGEKVVDGDEGGLVISNKHAKSCRQAETELNSYGVQAKIIEVKLGEDSYYCCPKEECQKAFISVGELKVHVLQHYNIKPFKCEEPGCQWSFYSKAKLNRHMISHTKEKGFECTYNDCGKKFSSKYNLAVHLKAHGRTLEYACTLCDNKFDTNGKLEIHVAKMHKDSASPRYACDYPGCRYVCFVRNHLVSHTKYHTAQSYPCSNLGCNKQFRTMELLQKHMARHLEIKEFKCDVDGCAIKFKSSAKLCRHKRVVHTRSASVQCDLCERTFSRLDHLNMHRDRQHSMLPADKMLRCLVATCQKRFAGRQLLLAHMRKVHQIKQTGDSTGRSRCVVSGQEATNLDFVALLSSVGEDILLPDELSCPEYEIRTEINKINSSMEEICQSKIPRSHRSLEIISNIQSPMSSGHRTLEGISQSSLPVHQRSLGGNSYSPLSVGIRNIERITESPNTSLQNINHSTVPENHNSMDSINQSSGGHRRMHLINQSPVSGGHRMLEVTNHSLVPDTSCDISLQNNQQSYMIPEVMSSGEVIISIPEGNLVMSDLENCDEYESMERLDFPSSQHSSDILALSIHQQEMSSLHINPSEMSSLPTQNSEMSPLPCTITSSPQIQEILINNITIPDEMIQYDPTDVSVVDGTSVSGDGPLAGYETCVIDTDSDIHMDDIELEDGQKTNIFVADKLPNNQTHKFLVPATIGDSQLVFFTEAGDDEMDGGGFQVIQASHIQVDESQVQVDESQVQVDDSQVQYDESHILISEEDLNDPDSVEEETIIDIHSENMIKHSTINLQDLK